MIKHTNTYQTDIQTHTHVHTHVQTQVHMHTCAHARTHARTRAHTHTHTHTQIHAMGDEIMEHLYGNGMYMDGDDLLPQYCFKRKGILGLKQGLKIRISEKFQNVLTSI